MPCGEAVSTALAKTPRLRMRVDRACNVERDGRLRTASLPSRRKRVSRAMPERTASAMRCSPSMPRRSPGCEAVPLKEARKVLTRALDLLVMGVGGMKVNEFPSKLSVRVELRWTVCGDASRPNGIESVLGKISFER